MDTMFKILTIAFVLLLCIQKGEGHSPRTAATDNNEVGFFYRYRLDLSNVEYSVNLNNLVTSNNEEEVLFFMDLTVSYYVEKSGSPDELISTYSHCYAIRDVFTTNSHITGKITNAIARTSSYNLGELLYSRDLNYTEVRPNEVKVEVKVRPRIVPIGVSANSCADVTYVLPETVTVLRMNDLYPGYDMEQVADPDCEGKLVPDYYKNCSKFDFSTNGHNISTSGTESFRLNYTVRYECFMPNLHVSNFYAKVINTYSNYGGNRDNPYQKITELASLVQQPEYCSDLPSGACPNGDNVCNSCKNPPGILAKNNEVSNRALFDIIGSDYFSFRKSMDKLAVITSGASPASHALCDNETIEFKEYYWYKNRRNCNGINQYRAIDRKEPGSENTFDGLTIVRWELLQRVEQYYGGTHIPSPDYEDFKVVFTVEKTKSGGNYINNKRFVSYPSDWALENGYFDDTKDELAICNQYYDQGENLYSDHTPTNWSTCPPLKMYYQAIANEEDEQALPVFTKYQYMVRETYQDYRTADGLSVPLGASGSILTGAVTYKSDIITEFHVYPEISSVDVGISYPCKNQEGIDNEEPEKKGTIKIENVVGGRPVLCPSYGQQSYAYELYKLDVGVDVDCDSWEYVKEFHSFFITHFSHKFDEAQKKNSLHASSFKKIPGPESDYNYSGEFSVPCGIYWVRIVPNNRVRNTYGSTLISNVIWGTGTYNVTPWDEPIIITAQDAAPVTLRYLPSVCDNAPYLLQAEADDNYESDIDFWRWEPPKQLETNGDPVPGEASEPDKKMIFPGHIFCEQSVVGVYENGCISRASIEVPDFKPPLLEPLLLQNVLEISATKMKSVWLKDFVDERFSDADGYRAIIKKNLYSAGLLGSYKILSEHDYLDDRVQTIDYLDVPVPELKSDGVINDVSSFNWTHPKFDVSFPKWVNNGRILKYNTSGQAIESIDLMNNYASAIFGFDGSIPVGVAVNARNREIGFEGFEEYPVNGEVMPLSNMPGNLDIFNAQEEVTLEKYHAYNILAGSGKFILTDIPESKYTETRLQRVMIEVQVPAEVDNQDVVNKKAKSDIIYTSARVVEDFCNDYGMMLELEDEIYTVADKCEYWFGNIYIIEEIEVEEKAFENIKIVSHTAHTGHRSLEIGPCDESPVVMPQHVLELSEGKEYIISAWIKADGTELLTPKGIYNRFRDNHIGIGLYFGSGAPFATVFFTPEGAVVEGWQKLESTFTYPANADGLNLFFDNSSTFYLDDIRIFPKEGNMQTYVYDPSTYRVEATLDQNNFATIYKYDDEGKLFQVKKETIEGIKTLQVNQSYLEPK